VTPGFNGDGGGGGGVVVVAGIDDNGMGY